MLGAKIYGYSDTCKTVNINLTVIILSYLYYPQYIL